MMSDPLADVIRPIVEGQIRSFSLDHPEVVAAVNWYKPRKDKRLTFVNSVSKRVVNDLLCPQTRVRLIEAIVAPPNAIVAADGLQLTSGPSEGGVQSYVPRPNTLQPAQRVHRRKVLAVARDMRRDAGMPVSEALA